MKSLSVRRAALALSLLVLSIGITVGLLGLSMAPAQAAPPQPVPGVAWPEAESDATVSSQARGETAVAGLIPGGSFEEPDIWEEEINETDCDTTVPSKIGDWSQLFDIPAYDGVNTFWAGGVCETETTTDTFTYEPFENSVSQSINVPPNQPILSLWYYTKRGDIDSVEPDDFAYIEVGEERIWDLPLTRANNTERWTRLTFDLTPYIGEETSLKLGNETFNADTYVGNILFDYITFQEPPPVISDIDPESGGVLTYTEFGVSTIIEVPAGAVSQTTRLRYTPRNVPGFPLPPDLIFANRVFDLDASEHLLFLPLVQGNSSSTTQTSTAFDVAPATPEAPSQQSFTFLRPITITVEYTDQDVSGLDEATLRLYYYDEEAQRWGDVLNTCPDARQYTSNPEENYIQVQACHLTQMGMIGK